MKKVKDFKIMHTCEECGHQTPAETTFGRWMRAHPKLQIGAAHLVRTDTDHFILKFMTNYQGREFQLMMLVETKERGGEPDQAQRDILNFVNQFGLRTERGVQGTGDYPTYELWSTLNKKWVQVRYMGYHLLQFEKTGPHDSKWIKWDRKEISVDTLVGILALDLHPMPPYEPMTEYIRNTEHLTVDHIKPLRPQTEPFPAPTQCISPHVDEITWDSKY